MKFIKIEASLLNVAEIESIIDRPGAASTLTFRGGRTLEIPDSTAKQIIAILQHNEMTIKAG